MSKTIKLWIARDKDEDLSHRGTLWVFTEKPKKVNGELRMEPFTGAENIRTKPLDELFSDINFDNSPKQVELKIIEDEQQTKSV